MPKFIYSSSLTPWTPPPETKCQKNNPQIYCFLVTKTCTRTKKRNPFLGSFFQLFAPFLFIAIMWRSADKNARVILGRVWCASFGFRHWFCKRKTHISLLALFWIFFWRGAPGLRDHEYISLKARYSTSKTLLEWGILSKLGALLVARADKNNENLVLGVIFLAFSTSFFWQ